MLAVGEYLVLILVVSVAGAFVFFTSALIFLLEEAVKFSVHFLSTCLQHIWEFLKTHLRTSSRTRPALRNAAH